MNQIAFVDFSPYLYLKYINSFSSCYINAMFFFIIFIHRSGTTTKTTTTTTMMTTNKKKYSAFGSLQLSVLSYWCRRHRRLSSSMFVVMPISVCCIRIIITKLHICKTYVWHSATINVEMRLVCNEIQSRTFTSDVSRSTLIIISSYFFMQTLCSLLFFFLILFLFFLFFFLLALLRFFHVYANIFLFSFMAFFRVV